ncbi:MAG: hypothetical protein Q4B72_14350, partial [Lachnospiraceae bacterium]|nr:hypothetical protein [Lachnospiraceae bacterium]
VQDILARETITLSDGDLTLIQAFQMFAFAHQSRASGSVDGVVGPTRTGKVAVSWIHDGIHLHFRNITSNNVKWHM